ncbi:MAG: transketolase [Chloroflexia bacterium]|nr:transketolase [Chloroflexia bacterium]
MNEMDLPQLEELAHRVRQRIVRMATGGGCFLGSALSCTDLLVYLYSNFLRFNPHQPSDPERDYLFLSKGHAVPALYATLVEMGRLEAKRLQNHLQIHDDVYWHPNRNIPGVEFHSGSLGHLLPVAVGVAMDCKLRRQDNWVVVIVGDGELNEGSNWEACLVASAHQLDNLLVIVDRNSFQANLRTEALIPLESLGNKFHAFGWRTMRVSGHNFEAMHKAFSHLPISPGQPNVIIADTVRGQGLPSIAQRADRWFCDFSAVEIEQLLDELDRDRPLHIPLQIPVLDRI